MILAMCECVRFCILPCWAACIIFYSMVFYTKIISFCFLLLLPLCACVCLTLTLKPPSLADGEHQHVCKSIFAFVSRCGLLQLLLLPCFLFVLNCFAAWRNTLQQILCYLVYLGHCLLLQISEISLVAVTTAATTTAAAAAAAAAAGGCKYSAA